MPADNSVGIYSESTESKCDFAWLLFVGTKMLGFSEKDVGHMTIKKWSQLFYHFKTYHNFCMQKSLFKEEKFVRQKSSDEWLP